MLITIIIPVYNGEKHIGQCIDKVLQQTYKNIEIIIINDGSTDNTSSILRKYLNKDSRIKIINKINTGVSDSRNIGIKEARGEFILFLDSDDSLENTAVEKIVGQLNNDVDLLIFGFKITGDKRRHNDTNCLKKMEGRIEKNNVLKHLISTTNNIYGYIWRACYSKKMLINNNIFFSNGIKISEDFLFLANVIYNSEKIIIDSTEYYIYNINDCSMSTKYIPTLLNDMNFVNSWIHDNIVVNNCELKYGYYCCCANTYLRFVQNTLREKKVKTKLQIKTIRDNREKFREALSNIRLFKDFNLKDSLQLFFLKSNLQYIYVILFKLKEYRKKEVSMDNNTTCAIVTINNSNYGNRLQNYATQEILKKRGYNVLTIKNTGMMNKRKNFVNYVIRNIYHIFKKKDFDDGEERENKFEEFNKHINFLDKEFNWFNTKYFSNFDYYFVGSDQVWNPNYRMSEFDLLDFTQSTNKVSFAASIGVESLTDEQCNKMKEAIKKFKKISVREEKGLEIIKKILPEKNIEVLIDPTMMIAQEEWDKVMKNPGINNEKKYILTYFLGEISTENLNVIQQYATENDCEIIDILDKSSTFYNSGPSEFLFLEKYAHLICTDSFHSSVFGILYDTPFVVFDRKDKNLDNMNSRLDTLLKKFKLEDRRFHEGKKLDTYINHDYKCAYDILKSEKNKVNQFLDDVFNKNI